MPPLRFAKSHPVAALGSAIGAAVTLYGFASDAYGLWTANLMPWVWQAVGAAIFFVAVVTMIYSLWLRYETLGEPSAASASQPSPNPSAEPPAQDNEGVYEGAHEILMLFVVRHLMPTVDALFSLQTAVADSVAAQGEAGDLMRDGVRWRQRQSALWDAVHQLGGLADSPPSYIDLPDMERAVLTAERYYAEYAKKVGAMATGLGVDYTAAKPWREWWERHGYMILAYEPIQQDSRFPHLFRPARPARWAFD